MYMGQEEDLVCKMLEDELEAQDVDMRELRVGTRCATGKD